jgi:hypothetical protein
MGICVRKKKSCLKNELKKTKNININTNKNNYNKNMSDLLKQLKKEPFNLYLHEENYTIYFNEASVISKWKTTLEKKDFFFPIDIQSTTNLNNEEIIEIPYENIKTYNYSQSNKIFGMAEFRVDLQFIFKEDYNDVILLLFLQINKVVNILLNLDIRNDDDTLTRQYFFSFIMRNYMLFELIFPPSLYSALNNQRLTKKFFFSIQSYIFTRIVQIINKYNDQDSAKLVQCPPSATDFSFLGKSQDKFFKELYLTKEKRISKLSNEFTLHLVRNKIINNSIPKK